MPNLYGVANGPGGLVLLNTIGGVNITCPAGTNTPVMTSLPFLTPNNGWFWAVAWAQLVIAMGATAPSGITLGIQIGAGSVVNPVGPGGNFIASTTVQVGFVTASVPSQTAFNPPGSTVSLVLNPVGQQVTCNVAGSWAMIMQMRAFDQ